MKKSLFTLACAVVVAGALNAAEEKGKINRDYWTGKAGNLGVLKSSAKEQLKPTGSDTLTSFEAVDWKTGKKHAHFAEKYSQRIYGYLIPDVSGEYVFCVAVDDQAELALSPDADPKKAKNIVKVTKWTFPRIYDKYPEQKSKPVKLEAGKKYYIEAVMFEGGGGDNLSVAWIVPGSKDKKPVIIPGKNLSTIDKKK